MGFVLDRDAAAEPFDNDWRIGARRPIAPAQGIDSGRPRSHDGRRGGGYERGRAMKSLTGHLLIAMSRMLYPRFSRSVVYVCAHSENEGAMGLVVNKLF